MPAIPGKAPSGTVVPGSAGVPPAVGRRPTGVSKRASLPPHGGGGGCPRSREVAQTWLNRKDGGLSRNPGHACRDLLGDGERRREPGRLDPEEVHQPVDAVGFGTLG